MYAIRSYYAGAEEYIHETFHWSKFLPNEGDNYGGKFGPYKQSARQGIYIKYAHKLIDEEKAYYAFDTPEELEMMRQRLKEEKADNQVYDSLSRLTMRNSLTRITSYNVCYTKLLRWQNQ